MIRELTLRLWIEAIYTKQPDLLHDEVVRAVTGRLWFPPPAAVGKEVTAVWRDLEAVGLGIVEEGRHGYPSRLRVGRCALVDPVACRAAAALCQAVADSCPRLTRAGLEQAIGTQVPGARDVAARVWDYLARLAAIGFGKRLRGRRGHDSRLEIRI